MTTTMATVRTRLAAAALGTAVLALALALAAAPASASAPRVHATVALKHRVPLDVVDRLLMEVSDPRSPRYGEHLTRDEVAELVGVSAADEAAVRRWAFDRLGAVRAELSATRDALVVELPADGPLRSSAHPDGLDLVAGHADAERLVEFVAEHRAPSTMTAEERARLWTVPGSPDGLATFAAQREAYGIPADINGTVAGNRQMVWGPGSFGYSAVDLALYLSDFQVPTTASQAHTLGYHGRPGGDNFGEATLDTQTITSSGLGVETVVANTDNSSSAEESTGFGPALLGFTGLLLNTSDSELPRVVSMSLGSLSWASCNLMCEKASAIGNFSMADCLHYVQDETRQVCMYPSQAQEARIEANFALLGLRGVTLASASGDGGSHYSFGPFAGARPAFDAVLNEVSCTYNFPTYPSGSAYVLAVGGTTWEGASPSAPVPWSGSGGGFAWQYKQPKWQAAVVDAYVAANNGSSAFPPASGFNAAGRAYPDVAAVSTGVPIVVNGGVVAAGGTSASTPAFAGVLSIVNAQRIRAGLKPLGFVVPRVYMVGAAHPGAAFYDTTTGSSACNSGGPCCATGFPGATGWDPLTGFGRPVWSGLAKFFCTDDHM